MARRSNARPPWAFLQVACLIVCFTILRGCKKGVRQHNSDRFPGDAEIPAPSSSSTDRVPTRGGLRGRQAAEPDTEPTTKSVPKTETLQGPMNSYLRGQWTAGKLKTPQVKKIALHSVGQGVTGMDGLAAIGNWGRNPKNMFRTMKAILGWPEGVAPLSFIVLDTVKGAK